MKLISCYLHGEVRAICLDSILLIYKCPDCLQLEIWNKENEPVQD